MTSLLLALPFIVAEPDLRIEPGTNAAAPKVFAHLSRDVAAALPEGKLSQKEGERHLRLMLAPKGEVAGPAILGTYVREGETLTLVPRFSLTPGERYRAMLTIGGKETVSEYVVPARKAAAPATVAAVYPSADEVPANLLKFYLHFSKPMREGPAIFDRVQLLDDQGEALEDPWRRTELWNEDATRLTLWIHPGRIKEGVNLRNELGPVLEPNRKYTLVIDDKLLDADGRPLGAAFKKTFRTAASVRTAIEVRDWTTGSPQAGTRMPVEVKFPRPLDRALLGRSLAVTDAEGRPVPGAVEVGAKERSWSFVPSKPWAQGEHTITVDDRLEDLAGNTIRRPFDLNLKAPPMREPPLTLTFRVKK